MTLFDVQGSIFVAGNVTGVGPVYQPHTGEAEKPDWGFAIYFVGSAVGDGMLFRYPSYEAAKEARDKVVRSLVIAQ